MRRRAVVLAGVLLLGTPAVSYADKLPTDEGLRATLSPGTTQMRVGQVVDFTMSFTDDDDAVSVETSIEVQTLGGNGMASDGSCSSPLQRRQVDGQAHARAKVSKPGRYVIRGVVSTIACHRQETGIGSERVAVSRTITVTR